MAYRIDYGPPILLSKDRLSLRMPLLTLAFFLVFLIGVKIAWPAGSEKLFQLLLSFRNPSGSQAAVEAFLSDLKSGQSFYDSLSAFCRQIIAYADIPAA